MIFRRHRQNQKMEIVPVAIYILRIQQTRRKIDSPENVEEFHQNDLIQEVLIQLLPVHQLSRRHAKV